MRSVLTVTLVAASLFAAGIYAVTRPVYYFMPWGSISIAQIETYDPVLRGVDGSAFECFRARERMIEKFPSSQPMCIPVPLLRHWLIQTRNYLRRKF